MSSQSDRESLADEPAAREPPGYAWARIPLAGTVVMICLQIGLLVLLNLYPGWIGVVHESRPGTYTPILSPALLHHLPLVNVCLSLSLTLSLVNLGLRRWTPGTRLADLGLGVFLCVLLGLLIRDRPILATEWYRSLWGTPLAAIDQHVVPALEQIAGVLLRVVLALTALRVLVGTLRLGRACSDR